MKRINGGSGTSSSRDDKVKARLVPALGDLWAHVPAERLFIYNSEGFRGLALHKSPSSPQMLIDLNEELPSIFSTTSTTM